MPGETVTCGNGMTDEIRNALASILHLIIPSMFKAQEPWALMGSTASVLQGIPDYSPPDIDLTTTRDGAYIMEGAIGHSAATIRPVAFSVREPYASFFGVLEVLGVKVELMGDLIIKCDDGVIDLQDHWSRWSDKVRVLHFEGFHVPVAPLEWQLIANTLLRRPERSRGIAQFLLERGFDGSYLRALLMDERLGERTIREVKQAVHLDD
jgi:hypothetical protein